MLLTKTSRVCCLWINETFGIWNLYCLYFLRYYTYIRILRHSLEKPKGINIYNHNLVNNNSNDWKPFISQVIEPANAAYTLLQTKATSNRNYFLSRGFLRFFISIATSTWMAKIVFSSFPFPTFMKAHILWIKSSHPRESSPSPR